LSYAVQHTATFGEPRSQNYFSLITCDRASRANGYLKKGNTVETNVPSCLFDGTEPGEIPNSIVVVFKVMVIQPFIHQIIDHTKREKSHRLIMKYLRQTLDILVRLNTNKTETMAC